MQRMRRSALAKCVILVLLALIAGAAGGGCSRIRERFARRTPQSLSTTVPHVRVNADAHYRLGRLYQYRSRHRDAASEFRKALAVAPDSIKALNALGVSLDALGQYADAASVYAKALELDPSLDYVHNNLGYSHLLSGDRSGAAAAFAKALELNPGNTVARNNLSRLQGSTDRTYSVSAIGAPAPVYAEAPTAVATPATVVLTPAAPPALAPATDAAAPVVAAPVPKTVSLPVAAAPPPTSVAVPARVTVATPAAPASAVQAPIAAVAPKAVAMPVVAAPAAPLQVSVASSAPPASVVQAPVAAAAPKAAALPVVVAAPSPTAASTSARVTVATTAPPPGPVVPTPVAATAPKAVAIPVVTAPAPAVAPATPAQVAVGAPAPKPPAPAAEAKNIPAMLLVPVTGPGGSIRSATDKPGTVLLRRVRSEDLRRETATEISNGSDRAKLLADIVAFLMAEGYRVEMGPAEPSREKTTILYRDGALQSAWQVAKIFPGNQEMKKTGIFTSPNASVRVLIGRDMVAHRERFALIQRERLAGTADHR